MIPVCNRTTYLRQTIDSVLQQALPANEMQISIVDNSTSPIDWSQILTTDELCRIEIITQPSHLSMGGNWNTCVTASRGRLIHILHDDDWILPGFYTAIDTAARSYPQCVLFACRVFFVDSDGIITGVSPRLPSLEKSGDPKPFFLANLAQATNPLQCPGIVVTRDAYATRGLFSTTLRYVTDCDMWSRLLDDPWYVAPDALCCYRLHTDNVTGAFSRTGDNLREVALLVSQLAPKYPKFDLATAMRTIQQSALAQTRQYHDLGDDAGATANLAYYKSITPLHRRAIIEARAMARRLLNAVGS
jgi:hypothetical protein